MTDSSSQYLRLHVEPPPEEIWPKLQQSPSLRSVVERFTAATGWPLRYVPGEAATDGTDVVWSGEIRLSAGDVAGRLCIDPSDDRSSTGPLLELPAATTLAESLVGVLTELAETQTALWQREAELAAGVPVAAQEEEEFHLAWRLESALKGGAEAVGCRAAGLYLLDAATTQLKLRSSWGLPIERLTDPVRPLAEAMADLEALLGHVVVLDGSEQFRHWNPPEQFPAAVCVPVSTPSVPLGTLWMFATEPRDFSEQETNIIEIVAGRLAADLEREMLLAEGIEASRLKKQLAAIERVQQSQLPHIAPLIDGWQLSGSARATGGGDFYDWFVNDQGLLTVVVGNALEPGAAGAVISGGVRVAARSHGQYVSDAATLLDRVNHTTWSGCCGDHRAALACAVFDTSTGRFTFACAGQPGALELRREGHRWIDEPAVPLGVEPDAEFVHREGVLEPGEAMFLFSEGIRDTRGGEGNRLGGNKLAVSLQSRLDAGAEELASFVRDQIGCDDPEHGKSLPSLLVVKRVQG